MKFFIDTANLSQIQEAQDLGVLDGVTTNPSLMAKEGIVGRDNILKHYQDICELVDGDAEEPHQYQQAPRFAGELWNRPVANQQNKTECG